MLLLLLFASVHAISQSGWQQLSNKSGDTVFIKRERYNDKQYSSYHAIYIESNRASKYYDRISKFEDTIKYSRTLHLDFHKNKLHDLPNKWCRLVVYNGSYYAYAPSDWGNNYRFQINDSATIEYGMEGGDMSAIESFRKISPKLYQLKEQQAYRSINDLKSKMIITTNIYIIDPRKKIAIFETINASVPATSKYRSSYRLMVSADNIKDFPMIVNLCATGKVKEFTSDPINYKELISKSKT